MLIPTTLVNVRGLGKTSQGFRRRLVEVAEKIGIDPSYLAAVISLETIGTFSPSEKNPFSGATGLIQFMPGEKGSAALLGTSTVALAAMTAARQLDFVERFYVRVLGGRRILSLTDTYLVVFAPAFLFASPETVVYAKDKDGNKYEGNKGFDKDDDKKITVGEIASSIQAVYNEGLKHPPIVVLPSAETTGSAAAILLGLAGVAMWIFNTHQHERGVA